MAAQKGKDLLLKVDSTGAGAYSTVAGLRSRSLSINGRLTAAGPLTRRAMSVKV